jgi:predicted small lipoprotein YifL
MTRRRAGLSAMVLIVLVTGTASCGQQGPLTLPEDARPIERLETPPGAQPEAPDDDERTRER